MPAVRLGLNIDHVATLRNARGGFLPDPIRAARVAIEAGADGVTAHLREDRRHIRDDDIRRIMAEIDAPLNLEMAATGEMTAIAIKTGPHACCIVPGAAGGDHDRRRARRGGKPCDAQPHRAALVGQRHPRFAFHRSRTTPGRWSRPGLRARRGTAHGAILRGMAFGRSRRRARMN